MYQRTKVIDVPAAAGWSPSAAEVEREVVLTSRLGHWKGHDTSGGPADLRSCEMTRRLTIRIGSISQSRGRSCPSGSSRCVMPFPVVKM